METHEYYNAIPKLKGLEDDLEECYSSSSSGNAYRRLKNFIRLYRDLGIEKRFELVTAHLKAEAYEVNHVEAQEMLEGSLDKEDPLEKLSSNSNS